MFFVLLTSSVFASNLDNLALQISKDPNLLIIYGKNLQALPTIENLPVPDVLLLNNPSYSDFFEKSQELSKLHEKLHSLGTTFVEEGTDMQNHHLKKLITDLFFLIYNTDASQIKNSFILRDQYVSVYNDILTFNTAQFFSEISSQENLLEFSGRITINGKTFSLLESNSKQIVRTPLLKTTSELLPASIYFSEALCTFRLIGPSYYLDISAPKYFAISYFLVPPLLCEDDIFVSETIAKAFLGNLRFSTGYLSELSTHLSDLSKFLTGANNYLNTRRENLFHEFEKTKEEIESLQLSGISAMNSSEVISALQLVQTSKGFSAVISIEDPLAPLNNASEELSQIQYLLTYCTSLGDCLNNQDLADNLLGTINLNIDFLSGSFEDFQKLFQEKCEFYVQSTSSDIVCAYVGPRGAALKKTAHSLIEAYSTYLIVMDNLKLAQLNLKTFFDLKLNEIEVTIFEIEPFISRNELISYYSKLSNLYDEVISTKDPVLLQKLLPKIEALNFKIKKDFFINHANEAEELRLKLFWYIENPNTLTTPIDFEIPTFIEMPISANSDFMPKLIYLLNLKEKISELEKNNYDMLEEYINNVPTTITCLPTIPPLGKEFEAQCTISFETTYPFLKEAFLTETLIFPAIKSLNSRNAISGDLSKIKSIVAKDDNLKITIENIRDNFSIQIKYTSILPLTIIHLYNETTINTRHEIYLQTFPKCPTTKAQLFMKHPLSNLEMVASHKYFLSDDGISIEVFCNQPNLIRFSGEIISIETQGDQLIIKNHFEKPVQTNLTFANMFGLSVNSTFRIEGDDFIIPIEVEDILTLRISKSLEEQNIKQDSTPHFNTSFFSSSNSTSIRDSAKFVLEKMKPQRLGCVDTEIVFSISNKFKVPEIECIIIGESDYQRAITFFEGEKYNDVLEIYNHLPTFREAEFYLSNAMNYQLDAESEIKLAEKYIESAFAKRRAEPYLEMAHASFSQGDFISAIYYAKFAILKAPIGLTVNWRIILAIAILGIGIWSQTRKKKEILF